MEELLVELNYLHHTLTNLIRDEAYTKAFEKAEPNINEFLKKSENPQMNAIEAAVTAMYGLLVLRLKGKEISEDTMSAMKTFQHFLALLADRYKNAKGRAQLIGTSAVAGNTIRCHKRPFSSTRRMTSASST